MKSSVNCVKAKCGRLLLLFVNFVRKTIKLDKLYKFVKGRGLFAFSLFGLKRDLEMNK